MEDSSRKIDVSITTGTLFRVVLVGALAYAAYLLQDLILIILTSVVLASAVEPATVWFAKYRIPRILAVLIVYVGTVVCLISVLYVFTPPLVADLSELAVTLPSRISAVEDLNPVGSFPVLGDAFDFSAKGLTNTITLISSLLPKGFLATTSFIFGGFFSFVMIIVISFYLAVQERGIENFLRIIVPLQGEAYVLDLWRRSQKKIGLWMQGQLLLGLIMGVLVYLGLTVFGVKYALVLAILAAVFELIPYFGPILSAVPGILLAFGQGPVIGLMVIGLYIILQQFENHLIYPLVVKKIVGVPPLLVIIAVIVGGQLAGFLGILISAPVAAVVQELASDLEKKKLARHD